MISGLVIYLNADTEAAQAATQAIEQHPAIEIGPRERRPLPLVLETATADESQSLTDWLKDLPGVDHIDVAYVHLEEGTAPTESDDSQLSDPTEPTTAP